MCETVTAGSFTEIVEKYGRKVFNLAFRITGSRQDAEDVAQETFLQVFRGLDGFRGESGISTWIYRIALNNCLKLKRKMNRAYVDSLDENVAYFKDDIPLEVQEWYEDPEKAAYISQLLAEIRQGCMQFLSFRLPEGQRVAYILRNVLDFNYEEIAGILGIDENTVKARLNRARKNLVEFFGDRCQWLTEDGTCSCKTRIGFALAYDTEMLKRVKEQAALSGITQKDGKELYDIDGLFKQFPEIQYKYKIPG